MSRRRYKKADPTATDAIAAADSSPRMPVDLALRLAAEAKRRGDLAGFEAFTAAARRAGAAV